MRKIPPGFQELDPQKMRAHQIVDRFVFHNYSEAIFVYLVRLGILLDAPEMETVHV